MSEREQIYVLVGSLVFFALLTLAVSWMFPNSERLAVLYSGLLTNCATALFTIIRVHGSGGGNGPAS